jgi:uncharacterized membrane protein
VALIAVTWYQWFLTAHILAAVIWVGGGTTLAILALLTVRLDDPVRLAQLAKQAGWVGERIYTPMSLVVLAFGFALIENGQSPWTYDLTWVQIALAGWAVSSLVGLFYLGPTAKKLGKLIEERGPADPEAQRVLRRILLVARLDVLLLLFIVFDMTAKPWM